MKQNSKPVAGLGARGIPLLAAVACLWLPVACLSDDEELVLAPVILPTEMVGFDGEPEWTFTYEGCDLATASWRRPQSAPFEPRQYPHPLGIGPGSDFTFGYDGGLLVSCTVTDSAGGRLRERTFDFVTAGEVVVEMLGRSTLLDGEPSATAPASASFFYTDFGIDSIAYSNGRTLQLTRSNTGTIERADFREGGSSDVEYYDSARGLVNPFSQLPVRYLFEYPAYWSVSPFTIASYDLRRYDYVGGIGGYVVAMQDLTFGDSTALSGYRYVEIAECP